MSFFTAASSRQPGRQNEGAFIRKGWLSGGMAFTRPTQAHLNPFRKWPPRKRTPFLQESARFLADCCHDSVEKNDAAQPCHLNANSKGNGWPALGIGPSYKLGVNEPCPFVGIVLGLPLLPGFYGCSCGRHCGCHCGRSAAFTFVAAG